MLDVPVEARRERFEVTGVVQGVGFRPHVHRLATELGLIGRVGNDSTKVFAEVEGPPRVIDEFDRRLRREAPPLAQIHHVTRVALDRSGSGADGFAIVDSTEAEGARTFVPPDTAVCVDCVAELVDPHDRRFGHPFITCTNCGPRFTIIERLPYDRGNTTMAAFEMCRECRNEYEDPNDRRYHAQPISCHHCGPRLVRRWGSDLVTDPRAAIADTVADLRDGRIVAIKGLGGYHLACDAGDDLAVQRLRTRKHRADKPFAVLVPDLDTARGLAELNEHEASLLASAQAPIVLLTAQEDNGLAASVAPGNPLVGVLLAHTPIHHLLFAEGAPPLVLTSANPSGEPLVHQAEDLEALEDLFDAVLDHDRPIVTPCDDSVVRLVGDRLLPIRRARGYAPIPVPLSSGSGAVLAVGGELKNTFCVAANGHAWVSQHVGDMGNLRTLRAFSRSVQHYADLYGVAPDVVAADAHPNYLSSRWARAEHGERVVAVQHHHAHIAAVMAEHRLDPTLPVVGFAFDGTGHGPDATIWGGEVLRVTGASMDRLGHLSPFPLPGGDAGVKHPGRVALAQLRAVGVAWHPDLPPVAAMAASELDLLAAQLDRNVACVPCSSMGRLFDAVAALLGLRQTISYEAQAAIELEALAASGSPRHARPYRFSVDARGVIDVGSVLRPVVFDRLHGYDCRDIARGFHRAVADLVGLLAEEHGRPRSEPVVLSGGVFQNALLVSLCVERLEALGLRPLFHSVVPPNDGGLALGQAYLAAHRDAPDAPDHAPHHEEP